LAATELAGTGATRPELSIDMIADAPWLAMDVCGYG
jgi:hypothetical protein